MFRYPSSVAATVAEYALSVRSLLHRHGKAQVAYTAFEIAGLPMDLTIR